MRPGDPLEPQEYVVSRADLVRYAAASGDHNPIHQDEAVATSVGLPGVIAHGMYTLALAARAVDAWTDGAEVLELGAKFTNPVVVPESGGVPVTVAGSVKAVDEGEGGHDTVTLALEVTCADRKVLGMPRAVVRA